MATTHKKKKKITKSDIIGEQGVALIYQRVLGMGFLWHPTGLEAGIDGFIEIRDDVTNEVTGHFLLVQSKASNADRYTAETEGSFEYLCEEVDLDYWLSSNAPVIHLSADDSRMLLSNALKQYRSHHKNFPARVVLHKTSPFNRDELDGFREALVENDIELYDLVSVGDSFMRLFRIGEYPPLRGTLLGVDQKHHVLYTRGSVPFFETYTGKYPPLPLLFRCEETNETPKVLAEEILALTKMNWNSTQFDGGEPITVRAARQVGAILRYIDDRGFVEPRYCFYM